MKHQEIDASLRPAEPLLDSLDDGFSPPADAHTQPAQAHDLAEPAEPALSPKSPF